MKRLFGWILLGGLCAAALLPLHNAYADVEFDELSNVFDKMTLGADLHVFYRYDSNPYFGAAIPGTGKTDTAFGEIFTTVRMTATKDLGWTTIESQIAPYFAQTVDQDVYGLARDADDIGIVQAWMKFSKPFASSFDLTIGRQDVKIEKWFVISDGDSMDAGNWTCGAVNFPFAVKLDGDFGELKTTMFWARTNDYVKDLTEAVNLGPKDDVEVAGVNLHYDISDRFYLYGGYFRKIDDSKATIAGFSPAGKTLLAEDNTQVWDVGVDVTCGVLQLESELVFQTGDAGELGTMDRDRDAMGGFASITCKMPVAYSPFIRGTYMYYSGDGNLEDDTAEDYDPMFWGFQGWNRWVVGEQTGEIHLPASNKKVAMIEAGFSPVEPMTITVSYMNQKLAENHYLNAPTSSTDWCDEINLAMDFGVNDHLFVHCGLGWASPDDAAKEINGDDEDACFVQTWLIFSF